MIKTKKEFKDKNKRRIELQTEINKNIEKYRSVPIPAIEIIGNMKKLYNERNAIEKEILEFFRRGGACQDQP